ncbi:short-chain dehydrogenase/reductase SDR [Candidatus Koribacter versatilis Ellin345]|uniref:Short-chain dehydrogenase/reductase SDR n=1 Tax=Koribacter versatilis (strain Ellin345) TaxID=204669 RepID=Q1ITR9_KORVE|nr:SDR family oxidoreductase [Candidatus Koribacter versatilis]ABF39731.1 short-chain dehydrogenase/reductase SDR [Candidatus Koribacter versatilis Ellin345]
MRVRNVLIAAAAGSVAAGAVAGVGAVLLGRAIWKGFREISLRGKIALVTGSSRGLGLAMAQELAREGARLVICARDEAELRWAQEELQAIGAEVLAVPCDVGDREQVRKMFEQIRARYGALDVLINNAGVIQVGPLHSQTIEDFEEAMRVMFWGLVYPTLEAIRDMRAMGSGHIANITSIGGRIAVPHLVPYSAAKFAAIGFSEGIHAELAKDGITVTTVVPGLMRTGSHVNARYKGDHRKEYAWFSLGASTPVTAMSAHRAARCVITAVKRGRSSVTLSPQAKLAALAHGIAPGLVSDALGMVNRIMPGSRSTSTEGFTGKESRSVVSESFATKLGRDAAEELHQNPEQRRTDNATSGPEALLAD